MEQPDARELEPLLEEETRRNEGHSFVESPSLPMDDETLFDYKLLAGIPIFLEE